MSPRAKQPLLPLRLFRSASLSAGVVLVILLMFALFGAMFFMTFYLENVHGLDPVSAGVHLLPMTAMLIMGAPLSGVLITRVGTRLPRGNGMRLAAVALFGLSRLTATSSPNDTIVWSGGCAPAPAAGGAARGRASVAADVTNDPLTPSAGQPTLRPWGRDRRWRPTSPSRTTTIAPSGCSATRIATSPTRASGLNVNSRARHGGCSLRSTGSTVSRRLRSPGVAQPRLAAAAQWASAVHRRAKVSAAERSRAGWWYGAAGAITDLMERAGEAAIRLARARQDSSKPARG